MVRTSRCQREDEGSIPSTRTMINFQQTKFGKLNPGDWFIAWYPTWKADWNFQNITKWTLSDFLVKTEELWGIKAVSLNSGKLTQFPDDFDVLKCTLRQVIKTPMRTELPPLPDKPEVEE